MKKLYFLFISIFLLTVVNTMPQEIRPIRDSVGFCWLPAEMDSLMSYLNKTGKGGNDFPSKNLIAAISPHDDYLYAAKVYYPLYKLIHTHEVVIFGVTHGTVRQAMNDPRNILIFDSFNEWHGTYSNVKISPLREYIESKLDTSYYMVSNKAQTIEHSIEALVPFLQYYNRDIEITPIMVTGMSFDRMNLISDQLSKIINEYIKEKNLKPGKDIFFLVSTDADHYGIDFDNYPYGMDMKSHKSATARDKEIAHQCFDGSLTQNKIKQLTDDLWKEPNSKKITPLWCGQYSVPFGLLTISKLFKKIDGKTLDGKLFAYSDSWTEGVIPIKHTHMGLTAPFSLRHWCGWLSAGFYLK
jgi:MEMO1 family protein